MQIYSPIGGYADVSAAEAEEMKAKGWFAEGTPGFVSREEYKKRSQPQPVEQPQEPSIVEPQSTASRRIGRPRRGSATEIG